MKDFTLKRWELGLALFIPFLGIISPLLYFIILVAYFIFWGYLLLWKV